MELAAEDDQELDRKKDCRDCRWFAYDMDGGYCTHETSFKIAPTFGMGLNRARGFMEPKAPCGPKGKLWEKCK